MAIGIKAIKPKVAGFITSDLVTVGTTTTKLPDIPCYEVELMAHPSNTGTIWVGYISDLDAGKGWMLTPGQSIRISISNVGLLYAKADVDNQKLLVFAERYTTKYVPYYIGTARQHYKYDFMSPFTDLYWRTPGYDYRRTWVYPFLLKKSYYMFNTAKIVWKHDYKPGVNGVPRFITTSDINNDGKPEIITASYRDLYIRVYDIETGRVLLEKYLDTGDATSLTIMDVDGDHSDEIIVTSSNNKVYVYHYDTGTLESWTVNYFPSGLMAYDFDNDGTYEMLLSGTEERRLVEPGGYIAGGWTRVYYARYNNITKHLYEKLDGAVCETTRDQPCYVSERGIFFYAGPSFYNGITGERDAEVWDHRFIIGHTTTGNMLVDKIKEPMQKYRRPTPQTIVFNDRYIYASLISKFYEDELEDSDIVFYDEKTKSIGSHDMQDGYYTCSNMTQIYDGKWKILYMLQHITNTSSHLLILYDAESRQYTSYNLTFPGVPKEYLFGYSDNPCSLLTVFPTDKLTEFATILTYPNLNKLKIVVLDKNLETLSEFEFTLPYSPLYSSSSIVTWYKGSLYLISAVTTAICKLTSTNYPNTSSESYGSLVCIKFG